MISLKELNPQNYPTTKEQDTNLSILLERVNIVRNAWGKSMTITSGLRSQADQERINPKAPHSKHLIGAACDVLDEGLELTSWLKHEGADVLVKVGLWCEEGNKNWVHFQCIPPTSNHRWFLP